MGEQRIKPIEMIDASNTEFFKITAEEMKWTKVTHGHIVDLLNTAFPTKDEAKACEAVKLHAE